jgi:hypothetical protein
VTELDSQDTHAQAAAVSILGLPGSGKTTYLAALWEALSRPGDAERALTLRRLPDERAYLATIQQNWLRCVPTPRTRKGKGVHRLELELTVGGSQALNLHVPDIAGEAFSDLWEERRWSEDLRETALTAEGLIVFIHARDIVQAHPLMALTEAGTNKPRGTPVGEEDAQAPVEWSPVTAPTQVKLIDLLQTVTGAQERHYFPLAIVLSAWDTVQDEGVTPPEFLKLQLPMLDQFFRANERLFPRQIFGVSAQGGDVTDESEVKRLLAIDPPSDRVIVVQDGSSGDDITQPLLWLLEAAR